MPLFLNTLPGGSLLLLAAHSALRALPGAGVLLGVLAAHGQVPAMADAAVAADFHQALNIQGQMHDLVLGRGKSKSWLDLAVQFY